VNYDIGTESRTGSVVQSIRVTQQEGIYPARYTITVQYGPLSGSQQPDQPANPLDRRPTVAIEGVTYERIADVTSLGNPIVNTANCPYDPPVMRDDLRVVIRITRNEEDPIDLAAVFAPSDKINDATWYGLDAKTVKMMPPRVARMYHPESGPYWQVEREYHWRPDTWTYKIPSMGVQELDGSGKLVKILDERGIPVDTPRFLDADGHKLTPPVDHTNIIIDDFLVYEEIDFDSTFGFPTDLFG